MDIDEAQESPCDLTNFTQITSSEFNVEIGMRQRMAETINARIAWAMLLKESLQAHTQSPSLAPVSFRYAALDALKTSEKPIEFFLDKEEPAPPNDRLQEALRTARPPPRNKAQQLRNPKTSFLFVRSANVTGGRSAASESELFILKCPVCSKTTFTSLQGLLNHARITHVLEWGTHEACVRACAVAEPDLSVQDGIEVGIGAGGILPGLRTIFEMAVGPSQVDNAIDNQTPLHGELEQDYTTSSHLTKTLGLHEDTPALAPFLGKEPTRRGIKAYQQDEYVDVCTSNHEIPRANGTRRSWRPRFTHRGEAQNPEERIEAVSETDEHISNSGDEKGGNNRNSGSVEPRSVVDGTTTRFHFAARIIVTDRSLSVDPDQGGPFSHKWMLTIDAPSYAQNITTILQSMLVIPLSSPEVVKCSQAETSGPPFVIVGLASEPFLTRIDLVFNGIEDGGSSNSSEGQPFSLEHWVDLDPLRCSMAVLGEEHICDVELDKRTLIRPAAPGHPPTNLKPFWKFAEESLVEKPKVETNNDTVPHFAYEKVLTDLLPRFPLTLQDLKRRRGYKPVSYKLVASESQFANLIGGRRKAIEWGRSRALRDAFNEVVKQGHDTTLSPLTTAEVYTWMREEGHLGSHSKAQAPTAKDTTKQTAMGELEPRWCSLCGLGGSLHLLLLAKQVKGESASSREDDHTAAMGVNCLIAATYGSISKLKPIDLQRVQTPSSSFPQHSIGQSLISRGPLLTEDVVRVADPRLTLEVRRLIHRLDLPLFKPPSNCGSGLPLDQLGQTPREVDSELAPYSLITMCLRPFIRNIILSGLDVAKRQKGFANSQVFPRKASRKGAQDHESNVSLLTPAHLVTGIRGHGRSRDPTDEAVLLCLSRLGTAFSSRQDDEGAFGKPAVVKKEQP